MNDFNNNDLKDLIEACIEGHASSQEIFFKMFYGKMLAICLRYCNNKNEARDVLQEGFAKVFQNLHTYKFECPVYGWMKKIFVNIAIDHYRKTSVHLEDIMMENSLELSEENDVFDQIDIQAIMDCLKVMPAGYRTVFNLFVFEGKSHKEIGEILGISEGTSKSQLAKSKKYLKEMIESKYF